MNNRYEIKVERSGISIVTTVSDCDLAATMAVLRNALREFNSQASSPDMGEGPPIPHMVGVLDTAALSKAEKIMVGLERGQD